MNDDRPDVIMLPPALYGIGLAAVLALHWFQPLPVAESGAPFWLGVALLALGGVFGVWGQFAMNAAGTNVKPTLPTTAIVTYGPFSLSRNPLYLALNTLFIGLTLAMNTWWGLIGLALLLPLMHHGVILPEERYLEHKFGETYLRYKARVGRYLGTRLHPD